MNDPVAKTVDNVLLVIGAQVELVVLVSLKEMLYFFGFVGIADGAVAFGG